MGLAQPWLRDVTAAAILAEHLSLPFERVADEFFASPAVPVRGWERAVDLQARIVKAVESIAGKDKTGGAIAIVSHGAVGTLLYCHLASEPISRRRDQPPNGGGNFYPFTVSPRQVHSWWKPIDL